MNEERAAFFSHKRESGLGKKKWGNPPWDLEGRRGQQRKEKHEFRKKNGARMKTDARPPCVTVSRPNWGYYPRKRRKKGGGKKCVSVGMFRMLLTPSDNTYVLYFTELHLYFPLHFLCSCRTLLIGFSEVAHNSLKETLILGYYPKLFTLF